MTEEQLGELAAGIRDPGVRVVPVTGIADRLRVELLAARGRAAEAADGRVRRGAAPLGEEARSDAVERPDGVLLLCTTTDDPDAWLAAGEALSELWLRAAQEGLSVVPLSQLLEVEETRSALHHEVLGGRRRSPRLASSTGLAGDRSHATCPGHLAASARRGAGGSRTGPRSGDQGPRASGSSVHSA